MNFNLFLGFPVALLGALLFGYIGWRTKRGAAWWGIGGAMVGLALGTILLGLALAMAVPYTPAIRWDARLAALACSLVIFALAAAAFLITIGHISPKTSLQGRNTR